MSLFKREQSLSEIEEESEIEEAKDKREGFRLSIAEKRAATVALGKRGLHPKHFSFNFQKIKQWLKTH